MVLDRRTPVSAKYCFVHLVGAVADVTATKFTDNPFWNFWGYYYGGGASTYVDLGFPEGILTTAELQFDVTATVYDRLDHIAKNLEITFPSAETTTEKYLGTSNASQAQNQYSVLGSPSNVSVSITIRGAVTNLMKLSASASTSPTGYTRVNYGSLPSTSFGLAILTTTNITAPTDADAVTIGYFINNCKIINMGDLTSIDGEGYAEASLEIEGQASDFYGEVYDTQHSDVQNA